jgi:hypothetical protein
MTAYPLSEMRLIGASRPFVIKGGENAPVIVAKKNSFGGYIVNPESAPGPLYISIVGPAGKTASGATSAIQPGASFSVPPGVPVWVDSATDRHFFSGVFGISEVEERKPIPVPVGGSFRNWPPEGPTGLIGVMYAYLYQEYSDDDDLQEFVKVLNAMQQDYVDTFNAIQLPIYPKLPPVSVGHPITPAARSALADWAMHGIYGWIRPTVYSTSAKLIGPLNTWWLNYPIPLNELEVIEPAGRLTADDDFFKRTLTWHFQKGDGKYFNIRWLKRRVMRFLIGAQGTCPHIDNTDRISIKFGPNWGCTIHIVTKEVRVESGAFPNGFGPNGLMPGAPFFSGAPVLVGSVTPNALVSDFDQLPPVDYADRLEQAVIAGILELPFQFRFNVFVG